MDCLISVVLKDSDFQMPCFVKRLPPESDSDSGFRFYLGCEKSHNPQMIVLGDVEGYLRDMGLYDLIWDTPVNYSIDYRASIKNYPHINYKNATFRFTNKGLVPLSASYTDSDGVVTADGVGGDNFISFKDMSFEDKRSIRWDDRNLFKKIYVRKKM